MKNLAIVGLGFWGQNLDRKSAEEAIAASTQHNTLVAFAHNRRFLPAVADIRERIASGRLGRILHIEGNYSSNYGLRFKPGMWRADPAETIAGGIPNVRLVEGSSRISHS